MFFLMLDMHGILTFSFYWGSRSGVVTGRKEKNKTFGENCRRLGKPEDISKSITQAIFFFVTFNWTSAYFFVPLLFLLMFSFFFRLSIFSPFHLPPTPLRKFIPFWRGLQKVISTNCHRHHPPDTSGAPNGLATDEKQTRIYSFTLQYSLRNTA